MGLLDSLIALPSANGSTKVPRLRRRKSWIGDPLSIATSECPLTGSTTQTAAEELDSNDSGHAKEVSISSDSTAVTSEDTASEYRVKRFGNPTPDKKTVKDVTFESISANQKLSKKKSRRLGGFISLLRNHTSERLNTLAGGNSGYSLAADEDVCDENGGTTSPTRDGSQGTDCRPFDRLSNGTSENWEERKASEQTATSQESDRTAVTVCRHASKQTLAPIAAIDSYCTHENPFEGWQRAPPGIGYEPSTEQMKLTCSPDSNYNGHVNAGLQLDRPDNPITKHAHFSSRDSSYTSSFWSESMGGETAIDPFSDDDRWSNRIDRHKAIKAFNALASRLNVRALILDDDYQPVSGEESYDPAMEEATTRRRDRIIGRLRSMRSNLTISAQPVPQELGLRRMKTFASLPSRSPQMVSLRGKSLVTLARLGGHSYLSYPRNFALGPLKLPACFVAMARFLRCHAPKARHVFFDPGDAKVGARLYDYFANHVLSAEKETDQIQMTMRCSDLPPELEGHRGKRAKRDTQVLSAASVFKALLAGLPMGILGSRELYRILVELYYARSSDCDLQRSQDFLGGASVFDTAKIQAMAQAMVSLTSGMQLELMCAVFGECALLLCKTEGLIAAEEQGYQNRAPTSSLSGVMTLDRLGRVMGPLLLRETSAENSGESYRQVEMEIERERVATMVIAHWRQVSRHLREWKKGRYTRRRGEYRMAAWKRVDSE